MRIRICEHVLQFHCNTLQHIATQRNTSKCCLATESNYRADV